MKLAQYFVDDVSQVIIHPFADMFSKDIYFLKVTARIYITSSK